MLKKLIALIICIASIILLISSCTSPAGSIVGKWKSNDGQQVEFTKDGSFSCPSYSWYGGGSYSIKDNTLTFDYTSVGHYPVNFTFRISGDTLYLNDIDTSESFTFVRLKN